MAISVSPVSCVLRVKVNNGTSASGAALTKNIALFSSSKLKASLTSTELEGAMAVAEALEACLSKTLNSVEYIPTSTITTD